MAREGGWRVGDAKAHPSSNTETPPGGGAFRGIDVPLGNCACPWLLLSLLLSLAFVVFLPLRRTVRVLGFLSDLKQHPFP